MSHPIEKLRGVSHHSTPFSFIISFDQVKQSTSGTAFNRYAHVPLLDSFASLPMNEFRARSLMMHEQVPVGSFFYRPEEYGCVKVIKALTEHLSPFNGETQASCLTYVQQERGHFVQSDNQLLFKSESVTHEIDDVVFAEGYKYIPFPTSIFEQDKMFCSQFLFRCDLLEDRVHREATLNILEIVKCLHKENGYFDFKEMQVYLGLLAPGTFLISFDPYYQIFNLCFVDSHQEVQSLLFGVDRDGTIITEDKQCFPCLLSLWGLALFEGQSAIKQPESNKKGLLDDLIAQGILGMPARAPIKDNRITPLNRV